METIINNNVLRLTGITRYEDVETGVLELRVRNRVKRWQAVWLTLIRFGDSRCLPRGDLTIRYRCHGPWIDIPRVSLNFQTHAWILPLDCDNWNNMGANIYLCSAEGWPHPLSVKDYELMTTVLNELQQRTLQVDEPETIKETSLFTNEEKAGMSQFWDEELEY